MATLLKRSDAPLYRVFIGLDCAAFVQHLTHEHCFEIQAVLHAPNVISNPCEQLDLAIQGLGTHRGNAWFEGSLQQAVNVFLTVLPTESNESATLAEHSIDPVASIEPAIDNSEQLSEPTAYSNGTMDMDTEDAPDPLWEFVEACSSREATKSVDVRAALEVKVGKSLAQKLLARTKPTVAQDASGKKNRVLKLGGSLLKLK